MLGRRLALALAGFVMTAAVVFAQTPPPPAQTPVPKPFPGALPPASAAKLVAPTATPAGAAQDWGAIDPRLAGVPAYPGAEFLGSFNAGEKGQRVFVFGTNDAYAGIVAFYKARSGKAVEVSQQPPIQQFDLGPFDARSMDQRPSVLVKNYAWPNPTDTYLHVAGTTEKHYTTLIQVIPATK